MESDCNVTEFLKLFAQIIKHNVKQMLHYVLNY